MPVQRRRHGTAALLLAAAAAATTPASALVRAADRKRHVTDHHTVTTELIRNKRRARGGKEKAQPTSRGANWSGGERSTLEIDAAGLPLFAWRCRVGGESGGEGGVRSHDTTKSIGAAPATTSWKLGGVAVESLGTQWSPLANFTPHTDAVRTLAGAAPPMASASIVAMEVTPSPPLFGNGTILPVTVEITLFSGGVGASADAATILTARLFGPHLALVLSSDRSVIPAAVQTMADFNNAVYAKAAQGVSVATPPRRFPVMDRFIGGDDDALTWSGGIELLTRLGMHGVEVEGGNSPQGYPTYDPAVRAALLAAGQNLTSSAEYDVPGAQPATGEATPAALSKWAQLITAPFEAAGYSPRQMTAFALADEPGWAFPQSAPERFYPAVKAEWEAFLAGQGGGLSPADFGRAAWDEVRPNSTRFGISGRAAKMHYYYTARFSSVSSAAAFSRATSALESALYKGVPSYVNLNNFAGRSYTPTKGAGAETSAAFVSPDWFDLGRARAATLLWTEDWFSDAQAAQWSYYLARLRSAARLAPSGDVAYGGYVVPRVSAGGSGLVKKAVSVLASGGKALKYFMFGPEYMFKGNCWSDAAVANPGIFAAVAEANALVGAAEELLWPATRVTSEVAILFPRSSAMWDEDGVAHPSAIIDNGNTAMDVFTVDYLAETFGLYNALALQRGIAVDFVDEDGLLDASVMSKHMIVFVTEPNVPNASLAALVAWAKRGGIVVTTSSAATADELNQPSDILTGASGLRSIHNGRTPRGSHQLGPFGPAMKAGIADATPGGKWLKRCAATKCHFTALGEAGSFVGGNGTDIATWLGSSGGGAAVRWAALGAGAHVHFAWLPGVTHTFSGTGPDLDAVADILANLTDAAGVVPPVTLSAQWIEAPLLHGPAGSVVALLNWTSHGQDNARRGDWGDVGSAAHGTGAAVVELNVTLGYNPSSARSVKHGPLTAISRGDGIVSVAVPLDDADFLLFAR